jgi:hypothetical protein
LDPAADIAGSAAVGSLAATLADANIAPAPPVPTALLPSFRLLGPWHYGTLEIEPMSMYMLDYPPAALSDELPVHVAFSHAGHGINSFSLNYQLLLDHLALFAQVAWGGVYMDMAQQARRASSLFADCHRLLAAHDSWRRSDPDAQGRLFVVESDFRYVHVCTWLEPTTNPEIKSWREAYNRSGMDAIAEAIKQLESKDPNS